MLRYTVTILALLSIALSQRPSNISICDYYTPKILGENTASNQKLLLTLLVNTFVIGNYTTPNIGIPVAGIASPNVYNGTAVNLLPYFTGAYNSSNEGGLEGVSKLFLDDGQAAPVAKNMSSNGDVNSAQYLLFNHIYQYFGTLLGCSLQGGSEFPAYQGRTSMYEIHKFMDLDIYTMDFFILQCTNSALSLGMSSTDVSIFSNTLNSLFNFRCSPPTVVTNITEPPELQSVCIAPNCPLDPNPVCSAYPNDGVALMPVNITLVGNSTASNNASASSTPVAANLASSGSPEIMVICVMFALVGFLVLD